MSMCIDYESLVPTIAPQWHASSAKHRRSRRLIAQPMRDLRRSSVAYRVQRSEPMQKLSIGDFMTACPHTIGEADTIAIAHDVMRTHHIRHLPVLRKGELVGMISERDLLFIEGLPHVDPNTVLVEEAMSERPVALSPETSLEWAAAEMAQRKLGSVVVADGGRVVGVFTCVDALRALQDLVARARRRAHRAGATRSA
jgi:acetoin utilization protein AcuB